MMSPLTDEHRESIWEDVEVDVFGSEAPSLHPVLLSIGAQPGAGKTRATAATRRSFYAGRSFVPIIGDDFRPYHPDYRALVSSPDPDLMPAVTAELAGWLVRRSLEHAARHRYCAIVEGTLRSPETTLGTIRQFAAAGATTHLVILGVPEVDSWTGCIDRYLSALESGNPARWTPLAAHDAGYRGTPRTLAAARDCPELHRLTVVDRSGGVAHDDVRGADGAWARPAGGPEALERLRAARDPGAEERVARLAARAARLKADPTVLAGLDHARRLVESGQADARALLESLTVHEHDVLVLLTRGLSTSAIAQELSITQATLHVYIRRIRSKLKLKDHSEGVWGSFPEDIW